MVKSKYQTLLQLSRSKHLHNGMFSKLVKEVLTALTHELNVERAGFWVFQKEEDGIKNVYQFDKNSMEFSTGGVFAKSNYPHLYDTLTNKLIIKIDDAASSTEIREIKDSYIIPNNIKAILGIQIWHREVILGIILVEQVEENHKWTTHDKIYLTTGASYISQSYSSQLRIKEKGLRQLTEANYVSVFNDSPFSMLIYDPKTWKILDANSGAISLYGYTLDLFRQLTIKDLRANVEGVPSDTEYENSLMVKWEKSEWTHHKKNGSNFMAQISGDATTYIGKSARIAVTIDITDDKKAREEKEAMINKLEDYAFYTSHNIRRPISSILAIIDLVKMSWDHRANYEELMANLQLATMDLDEVIGVMNAKLELD